jgi:FADH2 O2-dependent halogenase
MKADVVILGSGFSGSLLGWILARQGLRVVLLDRATHPRFAIGESSTPVADMLLGLCAARYDLPALAPLSRYGSWKRASPELGCGLKRGFSYFAHASAGNDAGRPFADTPDHAASLLVAASADDESSDTHWLRSDVDAFLFGQSVAAGVGGREACVVERLERSDRWHVGWRHERTGATASCTSPLVIDATGSGGLLARVLGLTRLDDSLATRTACEYTHVEGLGSWDAARLAAGDPSTLEPFPSDAAAQHHLVAGGWIWMLRFDSGLASVGLVRRLTGGSGGPEEAGHAWHETLGRHPSLAALFAEARPVRPLTTTGRLSRLWSAASGPGWAMLPTTCGFVDPLQSTGIAHALSGVWRLAGLILSGEQDTPRWKEYGRRVVEEVRWIDSLVSGCYECLDDFSLFTFACHLTFLATIHHERALSAGDGAEGFLSSHHRPLRESLLAARGRLVGLARSRASSEDHDRPPQACPGREAALDDLRRTLAPWDPAGLLDPDARNRFAHTAAAKPLATHASQSSACILR